MPLIAADDIQHQVIAALLQDGGVAAIAGNRVFPNQIPDNVLLVPVVVVHLIDARRRKIISGYTGEASSTVQVDSFGETKIEVNALSKACKLRLVNHGGAFGAATVNFTNIVNELDLPSDNPIDKSDRWRFRRILRCEIGHCEDLI